VNVAGNNNNNRYWLLLLPVGISLTTELVFVESVSITTSMFYLASIANE